MEEGGEARAQIAYGLGMRVRVKIEGQFLRGGADGEKSAELAKSWDRENLFARRPRRPHVDAELDGRVVEGDVEALDLGVALLDHY